MADSRMLEGIDKLSLGHIVVTESKDVIKKQAKETQQDGGTLETFRSQLKQLPAVKYNDLNNKINKKVLIITKIIK